MHACILVKAVPTRMEKILEEVKKIEEVGKAYLTYGRWDIVAFIQISSYDQIKTVSGKINALEGVRSTETLSEA